MSNIEDSIKRYENIKEIISDNSTANELLNSLIYSAVNYVTYVAKADPVLKSLRYSLSPRRYQERAQSIDQNRRIFHNTIISNLTVFNKYLFKNFKEKNPPVGGIYSLRPDSIKDRAAVGDWAGYITLGLKQLDSNKNI